MSALLFFYLHKRRKWNILRAYSVGTVIGATLDLGLLYAVIRMKG